MPTKDKNQTIDETPAAASQPATTQHTTVVRRSPPWKLIIIGIIVTIIIIALIAAAWAFVASRHKARAGLGVAGFGNGRYYQRGGAGGGRGGRMQAVAARGVVTAINGDTLTVSGAGKQVTVTKNSSTTVLGDKTDLAVNDTVVIYGTTNSDGSVTATQIVVRNQTTGTDAGSGVGSGTPGA